MSAPSRFEAAPALRPLRAFQRRTVDYVFRRFYGDPDPTRHFLVADEVGLGKTMVARGVIARAVEHLWDTVERIDVLYICSNQAIAAQNINRLNVLGEHAFSLPTRMTLLPLQLAGARGLAQNKVNFVSLTPGTTFDLRSSTGIARERALLFRLLEGRVGPREGLLNLLQVGCGDAGWGSAVGEVSLAGVDEGLVEGFRQTVIGDRRLTGELAELCELFRGQPWGQPRELCRRRDAAIGELRARLARLCVDALEPDLVILDEFQRFPDLLHGDHDAALLAREFFDYVDPEGNETRTLLLSATPYRMLTLAGDAPDEGEHYRDLLETLAFLFGRPRGAEIARRLGEEMERFRRSLYALPDAEPEARALKEAIEGRLRRVMSRTERVASTAERDAMVRERAMRAAVEPDDLRRAVAVAAVARTTGTPEIVEYWKSAPYLLNFMRDYALKRALRDPETASRPDVVDAVAAARRFCLDRDTIDAYRPLPMPSGRMRALIDDIFAEGLERRLWMPPSLPYYGDVSRRPPSKALVFSSWSMVPDAIAALLSYEAERRMGVGEAGMGYFDHHRRRPLQFRRAQERLAGLRALLLIYPSPHLAAAADPLDVVAARPDSLSYEEMRAALAERLRPSLARLRTAADPTAPTESWDWAGPAVLDGLAGNRARDWLARAEILGALGKEDALPEHVSALAERARARRVGGAVPEGALDLLVDIALGSPAVCALRALRRIAPELAWDDPALLSAAAHIAWGFRTLYNQHDTVALLRARSDEYYWHAALLQGARDNLQAVLDEYLHCLVESEGLIDAEPQRRVAGLAEVAHAALALRPSQIEVDDPKVSGGAVHVEPFTMRGRFAMRLADYRDEEGSSARLGAVREAFNSPFRPFVLATTSIGQEGLDFHPWCHRLYHWNLPANPVDHEQREGRVHRYKGHAIRLNLAHAHADVVRGCGTAPADPWAAIFEAARARVGSGSELVPFWLYDGPVKVERRVPMLPLSREAVRLGWLKRSLAVYRLAFGQPRQDDLLAWLERLGETLPSDRLAQLQIRLEPPEA